MTTDASVGKQTSPRRAHTRRQVIRAYLVLPHAVPILVVLLTTGVIAGVAAGGVPPLSTLLPLLLAMLGGQIAVGAVNELVDAPVDAKVKPSKPIPAGLVSIRGAETMTGIGLIVMTLFAALLGLPSLLLCALGNGIGIAYSLWFKRTVLAWVPYLLALPLLPIWVDTAVDGFDPRLLMLYPLGAFAVVGVYLSQSLPDVAADRASQTDNLTSRLGERRSFAASIGTILVSALLSVVVADRWSDLRSVAIAAAVAVVICFIVGGLYLWRRSVGVTAVFPGVALTTAILGIGWVVGLR